MDARGGQDKAWYLLLTGVLCNKAREYLYLMALGWITQRDRLQEVLEWRLTGLGAGSAIHGSNIARYCTIILISRGAEDAHFSCKDGQCSLLLLIPQFQGE